MNPGMNSGMNRQAILFVSVNDRCYASYRFFAEQLAQAVERQGIEAAWCRLPAGSQMQEAHWDRVLEEVLGKTYLAVVDFNSFLPKLEADGTNFITLFDAPFYNVILDHPLYHHAALSADTDMQRAVCVDECHAEYVRANYPRIGQVWAQGIPGSVGRMADMPFMERKNEILFCGTYEAPEQYWEMMGGLPAELRKECRTLAERMLASPERTMEEMLSGLLAERRRSASSFAARMQADFLADAYVRNWRRKQVIEALVREGFPLALYGQGWESLGVQAGGRLSYGEYVDRIGEYRFALNCMPGFVCGGHDRITNAMRGGAVCISDSNRYTAARYEQGEPVYVGYPTGDIAQLLTRCAYVLDHPEEARGIAAAGKRYGDTHDTWDAFAKRLLLQLGVCQKGENHDF